MTITGHLSELRRRLTRCALVFVALSVVSFIFIQKFVDIVLALSPDFDFVYLSPSELVTCYMKLALVLGLVFASPFILWQIWAFVEPGLTKTESRSAGSAIVGGFVFFLIGAAFCFLVILPITLEFFYNFNGSKDITASISFNNYMSFVLGMLVAFGVVFEMPVLAFLLGRLGLVGPGILVKGRKFAILVIFVLAAVITPPDVVSQIMTAVPMIGLYELSIVFSRAAWKRHKEDPEEDDEEESSDEDDEGET
ncbi:MAG: twin-arginine translocase subunit TatC [Oscillospiraceae bacterium]